MGKDDREAMDKKLKDAEKAAKKAEKKKIKEMLKKQNVGFWADFKKFITKGNVLDMAVAVVVATAFNAIVNGLVKYVITPFVTSLTSEVSINEWEYVLRPEQLDEAGEIISSKISIQYGLWLQSIVDFIIIAFSVFVIVRIIRNAERKLNAKEIARKEAEEAAKKAEAEAKAKAEEEKAKKAAAEKKAIEDEFYANVREQAALLREIRDSLKKDEPVAQPADAEATAEAPQEENKEEPKEEATQAEEEK